jgi:hypothetical protein
VAGRGKRDPIPESVRVNDERELVSISGQASASWAAPLGWAYQQLAQDLTYAFSGEGTRFAPRDRVRMKDALAAIARFLGRVELNEFSLEFFELAMALDDLELGVVRPYLEPVKMAGRPVDPSDRQLCRSYLAAAVECCVRAGWSRRRAAAAVAEIAGDLQATIAPTSTNFAKVIAAWHSDFITGKVVNPYASSGFQTHLRTIPDLIEKGGKPTIEANYLNVADFYLWSAFRKVYRLLDKKGIDATPPYRWQRLGDR